MKQELRTVERMVFIASDGKEFYGKSACMAYEANLQEKSDSIIVEKLPWFMMRPPEDDDDYAYQFSFVRDKGELDALKRFIFNSDAAAMDFEPTKYPTWVRCVYESCGYGQIDEAVTHIESIEEYVFNLNEMLYDKTPEKYRIDTKKTEE